MMDLFADQDYSDRGLLAPTSPLFSLKQKLVQNDKSLGLGERVGVFPLTHYHVSFSLQVRAEASRVLASGPWMVAVSNDQLTGRFHHYFIFSEVFCCEASSLCDGHRE